jgi:hypothetical protein
MGLRDPTKDHLADSVAVLSNLGVLAYIKHSEIRKMDNQMLLAAKKMPI